MDRKYKQVNLYPLPDEATAQTDEALRPAVERESSELLDMTAGFVLPKRMKSRDSFELARMLQKSKARWWDGKSSQESVWVDCDAAPEPPSANERPCLVVDASNEVELYAQTGLIAPVQGPQLLGFLAK